MNTRNFLILLTFALALFTDFARGETLEGVEKQLAGVAKKVSSLKANRHTTTNVDASGTKSALEEKGTYEMTIKDGKTMWRVESKSASTIEVAGQTMKSETTSLMVCDGTLIWSLSETLGQMMITKMKMKEEQAALVGESFFASMKKNYKLKLMPDATIDGKSAFVIEATPIKRSESEGATTYYIQKETALTVKTVTTDAAGKPTTTMTLSDIKLNEPIPEKRFSFTPPRGVEVMDLTK